MRVKADLHIHTVLSPCGDLDMSPGNILRAALERHGFTLESVCDGESFGPLTETSERYFFCAVKNYTQLEGEKHG